MKLILLGLLMALHAGTVFATNTKIELRDQFTPAELSELPDLFKKNPNAKFIAFSDENGLQIKGMHLKGSRNGRWRVAFIGHGGNFPYFAHYIDTLNKKYGENIVVVNYLGQGQKAFLSKNTICNCLEPQGKIKNWDHLIYQMQMVTDAVYKMNGNKKMWLDGQSLSAVIVRGLLLGISFSEEGQPRQDNIAIKNIKNKFSGAVLQQPAGIIHTPHSKKQIKLYNKIIYELPGMLADSKKYVEFAKAYPTLSAKLLYYLSNFLVIISSNADEAMRGFQHPDNMGEIGLRDSLSYGFSFQIPKYITEDLQRNYEAQQWTSGNFSYSEKIKNIDQYPIPVLYLLSEYDTMNLVAPLIKEAQFLKAEHSVLKNTGHGDMFSEKIGPVNADVVVEFAKKNNSHE